MGINVVQIGEAFPITVRCFDSPTRLQIYGEHLQSAARKIRWALGIAWWSSIGISAAIITGSILLEFVGIYSAFNGVLNAIYGASTIIMKVVGWN